MCIFAKNHEKKNGGNVHLGQTIEALTDVLYKCRLRADIAFDQPIDNSCSSTTSNDKGYDKFTVCFITQVYWNVI